MIFLLLLNILALNLAVFLLVISIRFFKRWGKNGYLIYAGITLVLSAFTLSLGLNNSNPLLFQAWFGILSGLCAWTMSEMANEVGMLEIEKGDGSLHFLMVFLLTLIAWRHLPLAIQFGITLFLMNWGGHIIIFAGRHLLGKKRLTPLVDIISILIIFGEIIYTIVTGGNPISTLWSATWVWIAISMIVFSRLF